ncbi:hypothetical protein F5Y04DRAFT_128587 [Hypomontagnella monticulosa]|nr:hypothetical protein F5Y04DRAFT_128587 [Hypomontagnella monticulosa]
MAGSSTKGVHNGETLPKPKHHSNQHPPTSTPVDQQSLRANRLTKYLNDLSDVLPVHSHTERPKDAGVSSTVATGVSNEQDLLAIGSQFQSKP